MDLMSILRKAGFRGEGLKMAYAIAMAESSGNARAHNPNAGTGDNSYGLFQINMLGAMGPERRKQYGLGSNEDLFDPLTNAKVAFKMSGGGKNWGPWSTYGGGQYKKFYGGSGAQINSSGAYNGQTGEIGAVTPKLSDAELAEQYGFTLSFLNANKEIKNLFKQMVSGGWDKSKFQAKLRNTKWWKTHSEEERAYLTLQYTDPAEAKQKIQQATIKATQLARQMGLSGAQMSAANMKSYAYLMVAKGYDEAQLRYLMGSKLHLSSKQHTGQAGELWEEAKSYMYQMGSNWSDARLNTFIQNIARGIGTMQDIKNSVQLEAKAAFPQWAKQIEAGQTVMDIAQPYMQSMTQILEINPGSLNLFDPTIKSTLNWVNPSSLKREAKPLWQFENELRADPRWKKTKNAQDSLMGVAHQVLADFGVKY